MSSRSASACISLGLAVATAIASVTCANKTTRPIVPSPIASKDCVPTSRIEQIAEAMMGILVHDDPQSAQFGFDSLRLLRDQALPILVCHLTDETPLETPDNLEWLFLQPNFELIGHYSPDTVGAAVVMVLGAPPGSSVECRQDGSTDALRLCREAWERYLATANRAAIPP